MEVKDVKDLKQRYAKGERNFQDVVLSKVNLTGVNLSGINLSRAILNNASLSRAILSGANLSKASLYKARLNRANFSNTNLSEANLSEANLKGTNFTGADLRETNFTTAIYDDKTTFPEGFNLEGKNLIKYETTKSERIGKKYFYFIVLFTLVLAIIIISNYLIKYLQDFDQPLPERMSMGQTILIGKEGEGNQSFLDLKELGVKAITKGDYSQAKQYFEDAIAKHTNSPETLIYLNNARIGQEKAYTIAVVAPIGRDPGDALEILRGVAQIQDETNRDGGINGVRLKVVVVNDDDKENEAKKVAEALVKTSQVLGVVGHWASQVTLAVKDIYKFGQLVAISPISTAVELSGASPYIFRTVFSDSVAAKALVDYMVDYLHMQKAAVFYNSQSAYSRSLRREFTNALGERGGEAIEIPSEPNFFDLSSQGFIAKPKVEKAIDWGAEAIMLAPNTASLKEALLVAQVNNNRLRLLGGDDVYGDKVLQDGGKAVEGMVVAIPWDIDGDPDSGFVKNAKQLWGGAQINWRTAMSYDAAKALIAAIERSTSKGNATRVRVRDALVGPDFSAQGASDTIKFSQKGDRINPPVQLVKIVASTNNYDFVPVPASIKE
ncbi:ABC transporter substrate-binding protein [Planktothrix sp. FACHB-1355]|uniref:ABC transporter substrate-binding protein n=1 Tax=Aerosakkonema funiforme FACHB-1375 TaxID=2949571 RepID=A0A926VJ88_9CYAN|nr:MULTISPECIES: ABC transporter substrate-binding protein [Oscillatoriales]MBD2184892.1 ABC transporter substrate-binding protein [Aerosakkonema funiforme FACHB-1375]MBD3559915.1 ABC transporter substrate-binding protein [Planktothrix sp. FACHB-1355]